ncbi:MAG: demethylmenaquinone methyltransferase [Bryobacterales bacterium]|nr:demethylmenaquinone methyltransferase [Bryobacterales bacterium]
MAAKTTKTWKTDAELFRLLRKKLFTAVVGDVLDHMGLRRQFLPPAIQPLDTAMIVAGRAMPVLEADYYTFSDDASQTEVGKRPFGLMLEALDDLKTDEVYVATGGTPRYAMWGELMSTRATHLGAAGAVMSGYSRDTKGILAIGFPTFSYGRYAQDQGYRGKVVDFRVPVEIESVSIRPGDIVFGDLDGVLIVPKEAEREAIERALEKVAGENAVRKAIEKGMSTVEAFRKFGVM